MRIPGPLIFSILTSVVTLWPSRTLAQGVERFTDGRDGHVYSAVTIGNQTWMAENLTWLPSVNRVGTGLFEEKCYYVYGYDGTDVAAAKQFPTYSEYGVLYNWIAAGSACPDGWHLPTDAEWRELERTLGMTAEEAMKRDWRASGAAGHQLKSLTGWMKDGGTNTGGFNALPGGCRGYGGFESRGFAAFFWTASTIDGDNGWRRSVCTDHPGICRQEDRRYFGCSVRCVKNRNP